MADDAKSAGADSVEETADAVSSAEETKMTDDTPVEETPEAVVEKTPEPALEEAADEPEAAEEAPAEEPKAAAKKAPAKKPAAKKEPKADDSAKAEKKPSATQSRAAKKDDAPAAPVIVRAHAKYVRMSARKARLVCDNIRGKSVDEARTILALTPRTAAQYWSQLLESAVANAENNHDLDGDDVKIVTLKADEGPTLKRFRPRAQGRASAIRKRTAHLSIALGPKER